MFITVDWSLRGARFQIRVIPTSIGNARRGRGFSYGSIELERLLFMPESVSRSVTASRKGHSTKTSDVPSAKKRSFLSL